MRFRSVSIIGLLLLGFSISEATFGLKADGHLDQAALRKAYMESDFEKIKPVLEAYRKSHPRDGSKEDRIFTFKYLGVMYAADTARSNLAESHFNMLLDLAPNIELVDMYTPNYIQNLFDRVKTQRQKYSAYSSKFDEMGNPLPTKSENVPEEPALQQKKSSRKWVWWGLGVGGMVGVGMGFYLWTYEPAAKVTRVGQ